MASVSTVGVDLSSIPSVGRSVGLSVCLSVRKVYCDKMADWIRLPFGIMLSGVGRWLGVLDGGGIVKGEGQFCGVFKFEIDVGV